MILDEYASPMPGMDFSVAASAELMSIRVAAAASVFAAAAFLGAAWP